MRQNIEFYRELQIRRNDESIKPSFVILSDESVANYILSVQIWRDRIVTSGHTERGRQSHTNLEICIFGCSRAGADFILILIT